MIGNRGIEGDVAARMDAYRGNPNALMQRYSQSQELIDLLALQKLKSEKEAAARDMQMKMAQQQAAQGQPPTVKEQREKEVMDMTKQELAQQMGGIAQQRQQEQQQKMQQLMQSGVAGLPAPGIAKMAGGGIVAFAEGDYVESEEEPDLEFTAAEVIDVPPELLGKVSPAETQDIRSGKYGRTREEILAKFQRGPAVAGPSPTPATPAAPGTPKAGLAAIDPFAKQREEEARVSGLMGLTPEQKKTYDENIAGLRGLYQEEMDPEARRERQLSAFLRGAGGRSSFGSVMAGGSGAAEAERKRGFGESVKGTELVQKKLEDIIGIERGATKAGIEAGMGAGKLAGEIRGQDMRAQMGGDTTDFMRKWDIYTQSLKPGEAPTPEGFQRKWGPPQNEKEVQKLNLALQMMLGGYTADEVRGAMNELFGGGRQGTQRFTEGQTSKDKNGKPIVFRNGQWVYP